MATKKKSSEKKETPAKPKMCMRWIDRNTKMLSDDPRFKEVSEGQQTQLPKGTVRVDAHTVVQKDMVN